MSETGVPRENHWPAASHWQTYQIKYTLSWSEFGLTPLVVIETDCIGSCIMGNVYCKTNLSWKKKVLKQELQQKMEKQVYWYNNKVLIW